MDCPKREDSGVTPSFVLRLKLEELRCHFWKSRRQGEGKLEDGMEFRIAVLNTLNLRCF